MPVGKGWGGMAACVSAPNGPKKKNPAGFPTAALAASANWSGVNPDSDSTVLTLITELAGIGERPGATTRLILSIPSSGPPNGHLAPLAVIWASVRLGDTHSPLGGNSEALTRATTNVGTPKNPRGYE